MPPTPSQSHGPRRRPTTPDSVALGFALLMVPAAIARTAARNGSTHLHFWAWLLQGAAVFGIAAGFVLAGVRRTRPSPGLWGLVLIAGFITALAAANDA
ncbi:hypothetical protein OG730_00580 [Streptomyces sp. NBC_01298]|uniref:hypothetical protein n=1 Tax=Streptomyces sp. NBC_01298 TaxID=2903817 RepID=UPI002E12FED4|nr:hypothetical protein OG730_00580 [Streptomyces sp. NBC_01298]